jgi:phage shock protein PspC (stress-responsive transcriptional regulator)
MKTIEAIAAILFVLDLGIIVYIGLTVIMDLRQ